MDYVAYGVYVVGGESAPDFDTQDFERECGGYLVDIWVSVSVFAPYLVVWHRVCGLWR